MVFKESEAGLYIYDLNKSHNGNKGKVSSYTFLTLVAANKNLYTNRQLKQADEAKRLYEHLGMPGYRRFFRAIFKLHPKLSDNPQRCKEGPPHLWP